MKWLYIVLLMLLMCLTGCPGDDNGTGGMTQPDDGMDTGQEECTLLGADGQAEAMLNASTAVLRALDGPAPQVLIETRIVAVDQDRFDAFGFDFNLTADVLTNGNGSLGSASNEPDDTVVHSNALGGPPDTQYLVPGNQPGNGFVGYVNIDFVQRFPTVQVFVQLPPTPAGCVEFTANSTLPLHDFGGLPEHENLPAVDQGFGDGTVHWGILDDSGLQTLLQALESDALSNVISVPQLLVYDGQRALAMINDHHPSLQQVEPEFVNVITRTTTTPMGIFSGVALDFTPFVNQDGSISLTIRLGTEALSFFYSTPFGVGPHQADLQVPVVKPSRNVVTNVTVPDGGTIVLGGFQPPGSQTVQDGIPGLSQLPLLGSFFQGQETNAQEQKLVILLTPHILAQSN